VEDHLRAADAFVVPDTAQPEQVSGRDAGLWWRS
jgi:hypothetical protein